MTRIVLAFTACLMAEPDHCEARELQLSDEYRTALQCTNGARAPLLEWIAEHPGWRVRDYRCEGA